MVMKQNGKIFPANTGPVPADEFGGQRRHLQFGPHKNDSERQHCYDALTSVNVLKQSRAPAASTRAGNWPEIRRLMIEMAIVIAESVKASP